MSIKLFGRSQIMTGDEILPVLRQGVDIPGHVDYIDGKPVKRKAICFKVICNVQPMSGRDLLLVPELDRYKEQFWLFCTNDALIIERDLEVLAISRLQIQDQITRQGANYVIQSVQEWGSYNQCRMMRIDTGPRKTP